MAFHIGAMQALLMKELEAYDHVDNSAVAGRILQFDADLFALKLILHNPLSAAEFIYKAKINVLNWERCFWLANKSNESKRRRKLGIDHLKGVYESLVSDE